MQGVYPTTALKTQLREIKNLTTDGLALITEGGRGSFVFGSERALDEELAAEARGAAYARRMAAGIEAGRADIACGDFVVGAEAAIARAEEMRLTHG